VVEKTDAVPASIRWLAVLAGCFSGVFLFSALGAPFLILGAAIQARAYTTGRWLMWVGAVLLSLFVFPLSPEIVAEMRRPDLWQTWFTPLLAVATVFVCCCDVALLVEGFASRRISWARGSLDWVVWIVAIVLSALQVWASRGVLYAYEHRFWQAVIPSIVLDPVMLLFDVALIVHAVKTRRTAK
jgi:hypothetical protein